jgi:hypothetical protein
VDYSVRIEQIDHQLKMKNADMFTTECSIRSRKSRQTATLPQYPIPYLLLYVKIDLVALPLGLIPFPSASATMLSMLTTHYRLSDSVNTIRRTQAEDRSASSAGPDHVRLFDDPAAALAKDRSQGKQVEDPYLSSWKASEKATHGVEGGVAGLEDLADKYATSHGDH